MLDAATQKSFRERFHAIRSLDRGDLVPDQEASRLSVRDAGPGRFSPVLTGPGGSGRSIHTRRPPMISTLLKIMRSMN